MNTLKATDRYFFSFPFFKNTMVGLLLRVKKLSEAATLPARGSKSAAGYDLFR